MMRIVYGLFFAVLSLLAGHASAASGALTTSWGSSGVAASSSCADVLLAVAAMHPDHTFTSCEADPVVVGTWIDGTGSFSITSISATPSVAVPPEVTPSEPVGGTPVDSSQLYAVVLAGLIVGVFALGYLGGISV